MPFQLLLRTIFSVSTISIAGTSCSGTFPNLGWGGSLALFETRRAEEDALSGGCVRETSEAVTGEEGELGGKFIHWDVDRDGLELCKYFVEFGGV